MQQYLDLVKHVINEGVRKENRTGIDTLSTFGYYFEHDLRNGFPLLTTKKIVWRHIVCEMLWFLSGQRDIAILKQHGCKFWDAWADSSGNVPSAYGNFWRHFPVHGTIDSSDMRIDGDERCDYNDQIKWVLAELRKNPMSRRMVVSAWAPGNAQYSKLPPCHCMFVLNVQNEDVPPGKAYCSKCGRQSPAESMYCTNCGVREDTLQEGGTHQRLCLALNQRSCDVALGVPYNIASYALLLCLFSHLSGIKPGIFAHTLVDAHAYTAKPDGSKAEFDHVPGLVQQLLRDPKPLPRLKIDPSIKELADIEALMKPNVSTEEVMRHFVLEGYEPHEAIPFKVAV